MKLKETWRKWNQEKETSLTCASRWTGKGTMDGCCWLGRFRRKQVGKKQATAGFEEQGNSSTNSSSSSNSSGSSIQVHHTRPADLPNQFPFWYHNKRQVILWESRAHTEPWLCNALKVVVLCVCSACDNVLFRCIIKNKFHVAYLCPSIRSQTDLCICYPPWTPPSWTKTSGSKTELPKSLMFTYVKSRLLPTWEKWECPHVPRLWRYDCWMLNPEELNQGGVYRGISTHKKKKQEKEWFQRDHLRREPRRLNINS